MKIAFDGTVLHGCKSGVGYYCEELLKALVMMDHADEFFVFSHQPLSLNFACSNGNLKVSNSAHFPIRAVYLHALLPGILDKINPDLCHYTNFLAPVLDERPYIVTIHDMGLEVLRNAHPFAKRMYTRRLVPRVARKAKLVLTNSEYSKWEIIHHLGIPEYRIRVTPLAASSEFRPVAAHSETPYFLYVGNLEPRKNLERLIDAFARLQQKEHQLIIVGNRWYRGGAIEARARAAGLNGRVQFRGYVPRSELPGLYSGATAFVYPSLLEGFGLPVVEAMACGAPVITSNSSGLREVAGEAALLVNPASVRELTEAMAEVAEDPGIRERLRRVGLHRAAQFSWARTAELTLEAYQEIEGKTVVSISRGAPPEAPNEDLVREAIRRTVDYANLFQYPLTPSELRERLFDFSVDEARFQEVLASLDFPGNDELWRLRGKREQISDEAIRKVRPQLKTLVSLPFVRMLAFSGSTAHRNMTSAEDVDLFMVVEDGKVWAAFLVAMVWAKLKGLRKQLCLNYVISDAALPLFDHDVFTAQQVIALKPVYGKTVYDRFISMNPFITRRFPNFEPLHQRDAYPEIVAKGYKRIAEGFLKVGFVQILERVSRALLGRYLKRKARLAGIEGDSDVRIESRRLKLHLHSHSRSLTPATDQS